MQKAKNNKEYVDEGYLIPVNYFKEHKLNILSRIKEEESKNSKIIYSNLIKKSLLIAASLLLLLMFFPDKEQVIGAEDLIGYVESTGIDAWEEEIIIDAISLENIKTKLYLICRMKALIRTNRRYKKLWRKD